MDAMKDFFALRQMWTPALAPFILALEVLLLVAGGVALAVVGALDHNLALIGVGFALFVVGPFAARLSFELVVLPFRVNETLSELLYEIREQSVLLAADAARDDGTDSRVRG